MKGEAWKLAESCRTENTKIRHYFPSSRIAGGDRRGGRPRTLGIWRGLVGACHQLDEWNLGAQRQFLHVIARLQAGQRRERVTERDQVREVRSLPCGREPRKSSTRNSSSG